jgi:hypothetical protein
MVKDAGGGREALEGKKGRGTTDGGFAVVGVETEGGGGVKVSEGVLTELQLGLGAVGEEGGGDGGVAGGIIVLSGSGRKSLGPGSDGFGVHAFIFRWGGGMGEGVSDRKGRRDCCSSLSTGR